MKTETGKSRNAQEFRLKQLSPSHYQEEIGCLLTDPCDRVRLVFVAHAQRGDLRLFSQLSEIYCPGHFDHAFGIQGYYAQNIIATLDESSERGACLHVCSDEYKSAR